MKKDIVINRPTPNPIKNNPNSYRFKCKYKDQHDGGKEKTTFPRWKDEKEAKKQRTQWYLDYGRNEGFFAPPEVIKPEPVKRLTFREYAAIHLDFLDKNTKSKSHRSTTNKLVEYFGDTIFADIKRV